MASSISARRQQLILALLLGAFGILALASLLTYQPPAMGAAPWGPPNACGPVGAALAYGLFWVLGPAAAYGVPAIALAWGWNRLRARPAASFALSALVAVLLAFEICVMLDLAGFGAWSGRWGFAAALVLRSALGRIGSWIVAGTVFAATSLVASELGFHWIERIVRHAIVTPAAGLGGLLRAWRARRAASARSAAKRPRVVRAAAVEGHANGASIARAPEPPRRPEATPVAPEGQMRLALPGVESRPRPRSRTAGAAGPGSEAAGGEALPSFSLLASPAQPEDLVTAADLTSEANLLVTKLADFGIDGRVTEIHPGPVVTTFEFEPAAGVKVNQIVSREDDLALALRAQRIRILAPIPGKGAVGVEIPNRQRRTVYLREVLSSPQYEASAAALKVPLGVDVVGQPFVADLTQMPHLLVAGATGSGKSVCLNGIITGLLFQHDPRTLQLIMIDPKMLELSAYNGIPHLVMPVITQPKRAAGALGWAVREMEKRYKFMAVCGARNITTYNDKVRAGQVPVTDDAPGPPTPLGYLVVVIDELADLMLTVPAEIEEPIARLAQMARAVGIHLVLATQRPSVDVITGVIKANFPSRIAFQVASKTDSRTVLDMNGAENLLGRGDMLFTPAGRPEPYRVHGAFVSEEESAKVVEFWKAKASPGAAPPLATEPRIVEAAEEGEEGEGAEFDDALIQQAARLVVTHQQGSTSLLQRRLKVGYSRAGRLMDQLEQLGVVGPFQGSKARDVLVDERWLEDRFE